MDDHIAQLVAMGFPEATARVALRATHNNIEAAVELCMSEPLLAAADGGSGDGGGDDSDDEDGDPPDDPPGSWACTICTLMNSEHDRRCQACGEVSSQERQRLKDKRDKEEKLRREAGERKKKEEKDKRERGRLLFKYDGKDIEKQVGLSDLLISRLTEVFHRYCNNDKVMLEPDLVCYLSRCGVSLHKSGLHKDKNTRVTRQDFLKYYIDQLLPKSAPSYIRYGDPFGGSSPASSPNPFTAVVWAHLAVHGTWYI